MVARVVPEQPLQRVPGQRVAAVVVNRLEGREAEEDHGTARAHTRQLVAEAGADGVHQQALDGMVVERAKGVGHVKAVVARVERS